MHYPSKKTSLICSSATILSVTAGIFIRRYILARRATLKASLDSKGPGFMEELVTHNGAGF